MSAELILWLGFGAFLPILPLWVTGRGVDVPTLGVVVAAWPAARLVGEPIFGWLADHTRRVPLMVIGLVASAVFAAAPLAVSGVVPFVVMRALAGLAAALYDPAARGYVMDAAPADRRGEAFGLYGAAQMAGFLLGPALGALAAAVTHSMESVFVLGGASVGIAALVVALGVREMPRVGRSAAVAPESMTEWQREAPIAMERAANAALRDQAAARTEAAGSGGGAGPIGSAAASDGAVVEGAGSRGPAVASHVPAAGPAPVSSLVNRLLIAAVVLNFGGLFAGGTWEVIWSLWMQAKGGSIEFIGFTFALFALPVLIMSPFAGRLVDRRGPLPFVIAGSLLTVGTGLAYTLTDDLVVIAVIVLVEAVGWALLSPALFAIVGAGSPPGRSATAQGVFGTAGTLAYILSALVAGQLLATDLRYPFYLFTAVVMVSLLLAIAIAGRDRLTAVVPASGRMTPEGQPQAGQG